MKVMSWSFIPDAKSVNDWQVVGRKCSPSTLVISWKAGSLLTPAVGACYYQNALTLSFQLTVMKNHSTAGGHAQYRASRKVSSFQNVHYLAVLGGVTHCSLYSPPKQKQDNWKKKLIKTSAAICWSSSNHMLFCLCRYRRMLFRPHLWPLLCELCRQLPVSLS